MRTLIAAALLPLPALAQDLPDIAFQTLTLDPAHATITFRVDHLGFSHYTAGFDRFAATLDFGTDRPQDARLSAEIDVASLDLPSPPDGFLAELLGANWFDAATHPVIRFTSDTITPTGGTTATVTGTMQMLGVSSPVTMEVTFNGGYPQAEWEPYARIGFSARGSLSRSAFGMAIGVPPPGSTLGVGDTVSFAIEAEFIGQPKP
ncbi:YceI family protein [Thalassococcus sp. CAU 1522]|uniref:YceI family protein n=1 Tax=Thalassococcus arenae TaxID=2851652 RepID=A0ABS6NBF2_9RHOB|nr:YceI family protein [Thalassococcus arenae]MBV2361339.1 YceI family protein [Thalassococcus arenae]